MKNKINYKAEYEAVQEEAEHLVIALTQYDNMIEALKYNNREQQDIINQLREQITGLKKRYHDDTD